MLDHSTLTSRTQRRLVQIRGRPTAVKFAFIEVDFSESKVKELPAAMPGALFLDYTYLVERLLLEKHGQVDDPALYVDRGNDRSALG